MARSASAPNSSEKIANARLPPNEVIEPIVARCSAVNSRCINPLLATVFTPKKIDVIDITAGDNTEGMNVMTSVKALLNVMPPISNRNSPKRLMSRPAK